MFWLPPKAAFCENARGWMPSELGEPLVTCRFMTLPLHSCVQLSESPKSESPRRR